MIQAKSPRNKQTIGSHSLKNVGIEFDSLLLGMMTVFGLELTEQQIFQNIKGLLKQLRLPVRNGLASLVRYNLSFLQLNGLIVSKDAGYIISEKGKPLGICALEYFRQTFRD